jgi:DnaJ-domain-containing protein 1
MPLEDAYKVLKTTAASTWESIEQTRRQMVQQSHPAHLKSMSAEHRNQALAEAKRVNAAYTALSQARCATR